MEEKTVAVWTGGQVFFCFGYSVGLKNLVKKTKSRLRRARKKTPTGGTCFSRRAVSKGVPTISLGGHQWTTWCGYYIRVAKPPTKDFSGPGGRGTKKRIRGTGIGPRGIPDVDLRSKRGESPPKRGARERGGRFSPRGVGGRGTWGEAGLILPPDYPKKRGKTTRALGAGGFGNVCPGKGPPEGGDGGGKWAPGPA